MKRITRFNVINHGYDNCQYFPGHTSFRYGSWSIGTGSTPREAFSDALETICQVHDDVDLGELEKLEEQYPDEIPDELEYLDDDDFPEIYYYIIIEYDIEK